MLDWEGLLFALLLAAALVPLIQRLRGFRRWGWGLSAVIVLGVTLGAVVWNSREQARASSRADWLEHMPRQGRADDYVSSDHCRACHPGEYQSWHQSFHRSMTQLATPGNVVGDFNNVTLNIRGEEFHFQRRGDEFWVNMPDPDWKAQETARTKETDWSKMTGAPRVDKRITLVTGSHHQQKYWVATENGNLQYDLPVTWLIEDRRWVVREDSIVRDPALPLLVQIWNLNCIKCHTTGPQPRLDAATRTLDTQVGEMGIACEACHGPAQEHIRYHQAPHRRYQSHGREEQDDTIVNPAKLSSKASSQVCGQCHSTKISLEKYWETEGSRFRPGDNLDDAMMVILPNRPPAIPGLAEALKDSEITDHFFWSDGMTRLTGREYNSLLQTPCFERGEMSCLSCHSMHQSPPDDQLKAGMDTNEACWQCHDSYRTKIEAHTHHRPGSMGSQCYNCHMPHVSWGLLKGIRTHQITNPSAQTSLDTGRPNACNLCHLDKTLAWTAHHLTQWYGQPSVPLSEERQSVSSALLWLLRGDAAQRALMAWAMGWKPAQDASQRHWLVPYLAQLLVDPYSAVRYRAHKSLQTLPGFENLAYDYVGPEKDRENIRQQVLQIWRQQTSDRLGQSGEAVLLGPDGELKQEKFDELLRQRDDRSVFIIE